ncbi:MAG: hypothetical protein JSV09_11750 [Thermoplasmata archaeon]|nr:MAG: hypothetical protein JSV09_11750 [Thermoplasmata archaeon]
MKLIKKVLPAIFIAILSTSILAIPVYACDYGMTPGFWKNHPEYWPDNYYPSTPFSDVFGCDVEGATLLEALSFGGGPGIAGAKRILARAAVALWLNEMTFPGGSPNWVIQQTCNAMSSGDRDTILSLAAQFDIWNNQGPPPGWVWP